jgi:hypothetical protein
VWVGEGEATALPGSPEADGEGGEGFYGAQSGRRPDLLAPSGEGEGRGSENGCRKREQQFLKWRLKSLGRLVREA